MDDSECYKSPVVNHDVSLNLEGIQNTILEDRSSPIVASSQPFYTSTDKRKKTAHANSNSLLDRTAEFLTCSDSSKTWNESTPSRESNVSADLDAG